MKAIGIIASILLASGLCHASTQWTVNPFEVVLEDSGKGARQAYQIFNNSPEPLDISVTAWERQISVEGHDERGAPAEDVFIVIPAQVVVPPNGKRTVRVQYVGPRVENEQAYRLLFEEAQGIKGQVQEDDGMVRTVMNISMRYNSRLFVRPSEDTLAAMPVVKAWKVDGETLEVELLNRGGQHAYLGSYAIAAKGPGQPDPVFFPLEKDIGILLAKGQRVYRLPIPLEGLTDVGIVKTGH